MPTFARILPLMATLALAACSATTDDGTNGVTVKDVDASSSPDSKAAGLAFTMTDFTSSSLHYYNFTTGKISQVLDGRSGDPLARWVGDKVYFFDRTNTSLNFVAVDPRVAAAAADLQTKTPDAGFGDPHEVLRLSDGKLLLSQWATGKLTVLDPATKTALQTVDGTGLDLSGAAGAVFKPESLWARPVNGYDEVYVANQSRTADAAVDGAQALFVFTYANGKLTPVKSIKLHITNPQLLRADGDTPAAAKALYVVGLCSVGAAGCKTSGIDKVDLDSGYVTLVNDLSANALKGNGPIVWGGGDTYYAEMATDVNGSPGEAHVAALSAAAPTDAVPALKTVHDFPAGSAGCCGLFADPDTKKLYVGDANVKDAAGNVGGGFWLYDAPGGAATPLIVAANKRSPYTGAFVPK